MSGVGLEFASADAEPNDLRSLLSIFVLRRGGSQASADIAVRLFDLLDGSEAERESILSDVLQHADEAQVLEAWQRLLQHQHIAIAGERASLSPLLDACNWLRSGIHEHPLRLEMAIKVYALALQLLEDVYEDDELWAGVQCELARAYRERIRDPQTANLAAAIQHYTEALRVYEKGTHLEEWAKTQGKLAIAYSDRADVNDQPNADKEADIESAIEHLNLALEVWTKDAYPERWAKTQYDLANCYRKRIRETKTTNMEAAIRHYTAALDVYKKHTHKEWAETQANLATAYIDRCEGKKADNAEIAIELYKEVLEEITKEEHAELWAMTHTNLADVYYKRRDGDWAANIESAIKHYKEALEAPEEDAEEGATRHQRLATAYFHRIRDKKADNLDAAIVHYKEALKVYNKEKYPAKFGVVNTQLAAAELERADRTKDAIEDAIKRAEESLEGLEKEEHPLEWAETHNTLGRAYVDRSEGDKAANMEAAIEHYTAALGVHQKDNDPVGWALVNNNLAIAHRRRVNGSEADNIEVAIELYKESLEVLKKKHPSKWADTSSNLAVAYRHRIKGEASENIEVAIFHNQQALTVLTKEDHSEDWARTNDNLATAYGRRIREDRASNIKMKIKHYLAALEVYNDDEYPKQWAATLTNLAGVYSVASNNCDYFKMAIESYKAVLRVFTLATYPEEWAATQMGLASTYVNSNGGETTIELAIDHCKAALTAYKRDTDRASAQASLARAYLKSEKAASIQAAVESFEEALGVYTRAAYPADHVRTAQGYALALSAAGRDDDAIAACSSALQVLDDLRLVVRSGTDDLVAKRQLSLDGADVVATFVRGCLRPRVGSICVVADGGVQCRLDVRAAPPDRVLMALHCIEKSRARSLAEAATQPQREERLALERAEADGAEDAELRSLAAKAAQLPPVPMGSHPLAAPTPQQWYDQVTSMLGPHRAAVAWFLVQDFGYAFVLAGTLPCPRVVEYSRNEIQALRDSANAFKVAAAGDRPELATFDGKMLHLASALKMDDLVSREGVVRRSGANGEEKHRGPNLSSVVLVPHGVLHDVPLHALRCTDGQRLSEVFRAGVYDTPSLELLARAKVAASQLCTLPKRVIVVQNPRCDLNGADQEAKHLQSLPNCDAVLLCHEEATSERLQSEIIAASTDGGVYGLYIASHGYFAAASRLASGVALASGASLSVSDVLSGQYKGLDRCALCMLPACESGLSDTTGEECVGLPAAMLSRGVPCIVSTLWRIPDVAAALFMSEMNTRLYQHKGNLSVSAALRGAQIWLRELEWDQAEAALGLRFSADGARLLLSKLRALIIAAGTRLRAGRQTYFGARAEQALSLVHSGRLGDRLLPRWQARVQGRRLGGS